MLDIHAFWQTPASEKVSLWATMSPEKYKEGSERRMALVDAMPEAFRLLVHEHGFSFIYKQAIASGWSLSAVKLAIAREREAWAREMLDLSDLGL